MMIFGDISWHMMIFGDIWWYLVTFHDKTWRLLCFIMTCHDKSWNDSPSDSERWCGEKTKTIFVIRRESMRCEQGLYPYEFSPTNKNATWHWHRAHPKISTFRTRIDIQMEEPEGSFSPVYVYGGVSCHTSQGWSCDIRSSALGWAKKIIWILVDIQTDRKRCISTGHYPVIPCLLSSLFWFVMHGRYAWCFVNKEAKCIKFSHAHHS